ncbi:glycosyltransferase family 2 protein [Thalassospira australica]|uniref:glycosyltransferase family 2 protein n=1 Tax=Thalassospira australica TaxID=1528106 RepID=UPI00051A68AD|nr:glycosyltransferase family 2 protein [Thalassospira australica]
MKLCAVVPTHNHSTMLESVVKRIRAYDIPVFIIDDGSNAQTQTIANNLHAPSDGVFCQRLDENAGKGIAVMTGMACAARHGFTHAFQIDADGQHDLDRIDEMIKTAQKSPAALITGLPVYDDSIPTGRKIGRWVTHVWVWIETLSFQIRDSMCGFRVYPIVPSLEVWRNQGIGHRMDFDTEIMVRLFWQGIPVIHVPTKVIYPAGNTSNFRMWRDNVLISWMHTRLVFGMLARLPRYIAQRGRFGPPKEQIPNRHWAEIDERGIYWGMRFLGQVYRIGGRKLCLAAMSPIIAYFFLTGRTARTASRDFLERVAKHNGKPKPTWRDSFAHFMRFGESALDKIAAWCGEMKLDDLDLPDDADSLFSYIPRDQAVILFVSHFGNIELVRAIASRDRDFRVNVLLHQKNAARFGRVLQQLAPESQVDLIEVNDIGPDTAILLREKAERGEWIVIAADRVAIGARDKSVHVPFLGQNASFPQGPYILAHLLQCPVYMVAAWREGWRFNISWEKLSERIDLPRNDRTAKIKEHAGTYAVWLEKLVVQHPLQWFNFYDFWADKKDNNE